MEITCSHCSQKFHIPDYRLDDKRVYFFCEKCNNKVVIDNKKEAWGAYKGIAQENLSARDILEGIFYSFNVKNIFISFLFLMIFSLLIFLNGFIIFENMTSLMTQPYLFAAYIAAAMIMLTFIYDTMLYLVSKNIFHRIHYGSNISFSLARSEILNDLLSIFAVSSGMLLIFSFLILPVYPLKKFGILYSGIFNPVLAGAAVIFVFTSIFKPLIISFIALKSRSLKFNIKSLFRFIAVENINIPAYAFLNSAVMNFIYFIVIGIIGSALAGTAAVTILSLLPDAVQKISSSPQNLFSAFSSIAGSGVFTAGLVFIIFWIAIILFILISYFISASQSLSSMSVHIMESNPGRSVSKTGYLISISAIFIITGFLGFILKNLIFLIPKF